MAKVNLDQQEADVFRRQFDDFLTGRSTEDNIMYWASETTTHTDDHNDNHIDYAGPLNPVE